MSNVSLAKTNIPNQIEMHTDTNYADDIVEVDRPPRQVLYVHLPTKSLGLDVIQSFVNWHAYGWFRAPRHCFFEGHDRNSDKKKCLFKAVRILWLFLPEPLPAIPNKKLLAIDSDDETLKWREDVLKMSKAAAEAASEWHFKEFGATRKPALSYTLSTFSRVLSHEITVYTDRLVERLEREGTLDDEDGGMPSTLPDGPLYPDESGNEEGKYFSYDGAVTCMMRQFEMMEFFRVHRNKRRKVAPQESVEVDGSQSGGEEAEDSDSNSKEEL